VQRSRNQRKRAIEPTELEEREAETTRVEGRERRETRASWEQAGVRGRPAVSHLACWSCCWTMGWTAMACPIRSSDIGNHDECCSHHCGQLVNPPFVPLSYAPTAPIHCTSWPERHSTAGDVDEEPADQAWRISPVHRATQGSSLSALDLRSRLVVSCCAIANICVL
jgi:hypothetical protein